MASVESVGPQDVRETDWGPTSEGIRESRVVIAADLVGYSELVFRDPHAGIRVLRETRTIIINAIKAAGGSVLDTPGDFVLATFHDIGGAIGAATRAQQRLLERHSRLPESE